MKRKLRLIWKLTEPVGEKGSVCTYGTDLVVMPTDCAAVELQQDGLLPELIGCEWLGDDNGKVLITGEAGDIVQ